MSVIPEHHGDKDEMILQSGKACLTIGASPEEFPRLTTWLECILDEISFPLRAAQQIMICADEIVANIASYAYPDGGGDLSVSVAFDSVRDELELVFSDHGIPFDPLQHDAPDVSAPLEQRHVGGLGILVVQRMMDSVSYRRDGDRNILRLLKRAESGAKA